MDTDRSEVTCDNAEAKGRGRWVATALAAVMLAVTLEAMLAPAGWAGGITPPPPPLTPTPTPSPKPTPTPSPTPSPTPKPTSTPKPTPKPTPSPTLVSGIAGIPAQYLTAYQEGARTCAGLPWEVLAAIGTMESDNGQSKAAGVQSGRSPSGGEGPMQFEPATFAEYAVWADRSRKLSPYDVEDAIFTAARMLCADGAKGGSAAGIKRAILAYNHSAAYVSDVQAIAARYTAAARLAAKPTPTPAP